MTDAPTTAATQAQGGRSFRAVSVGRPARVVMDESRRGEVIAVFRRSFYVRFADRAVCVGGLGLGQGPLNVVCRIAEGLSWHGLVAKGTVVSHDGAVLLVDRRLRVDCRVAATWRPPAAAIVAVPILRAGLSRLAAAISQRKPGGLGILTAGLPAPATFRADATTNLLLHGATPIVAALREWIAAARGGWSRPPPAVTGLIGLGPGLTPSGDDFLCGVMTALHHLGHSALARRLADSVLPHAATGTNLISASYLHCAAEGEASEILFNVLRAIVSGGGDGLDACLDAVHGVGHTSGWDTLAGAATACAALCAAPHRLH